jgi:hypothetical protein
MLLPRYVVVSEPIPLHPTVTIVILDGRMGGGGGAADDRRRGR